MKDSLREEFARIVDEKIGPLHAAIDQLRFDNTDLKRQLDELEQYGRSSLIRFFGIRETTGDHIFFSGTITMSIFIDWAIRLCCGFIWFLTLMCLSWPSAIPAALLYVLTLPFAGRSEITRTISNYLLRFVQLPLRCADNMFAMAPLCNTECNG